MVYADVIIDISHEKVDRDFQYRIPEELEPAIKPGVVVTVPFGKGNNGIQTDRTCGMDERNVWFYHDPGTENSTSCKR